MANESQFELFSHSPASSPSSTEQAAYFRPKVVLTFDNLIVLSIALLLLMVISFSVGVERGKAIVRVQHKVIDLADKHSVALTSAADHNSRSSDHGKSLQSAAPEPAVVAPAAPSANTAKVSDDQDIFTVQVASFKMEKYAQQEAMTLKQKGYEISVLPKGNHSIVCVGKFTQRQEAAAMSDKLRKYYKDCVVRNL